MKTRKFSFISHYARNHGGLDRTIALTVRFGIRGDILIKWNGGFGWWVPDHHSSRGVWMDGIGSLRIKAQDHVRLYHCRWLGPVCQI